MAAPQIKMLPSKTMQASVGYSKVIDQIGRSLEAKLDNSRQLQRLVPIVNDPCGTRGNEHRMVQENGIIPFNSELRLTIEKTA